MSSLPANTTTPATRSISTGGMISPPAPWVTSATPASAIVAAVSVAFRSATPPRQKPWRIVALPPETERLGAGTDLLDIEQAHLARLVQVNVAALSSGMVLPVQSP